MSIQRIIAIFEKDFKDFLKNTMIIFMPVVPVFLAILYSRIGGDEDMPLFIIFLVVGATFATVTSGCMMMFMAEENEKQTLRALTMSPASFGDIIAGKSLLTFVLTVITLILSFLFIGFDSILSFKTILGLILVFFFFLFIGIGVGLFVKTVGMTTAYMMPIMFIFGFTPMIDALMLDEDSLALKIANKLPIPLLIEMSEQNTWRPHLFVIPWVAIAALFMYVCYVRTRKDD